MTRLHAILLAGFFFALLPLIAYLDPLGFNTTNKTTTSKPIKVTQPTSGPGHFIEWVGPSAKIIRCAEAPDRIAIVEADAIVYTVADAYLFCLGRGKDVRVAKFSNTLMLCFDDRCRPLIGTAPNSARGSNE